MVYFRSGDLDSSVLKGRDSVDSKGLTIEASLALCVPNKVCICVRTKSALGS